MGDYLDEQTFDMNNRIYAMLERKLSQAKADSDYAAVAAYARAIQGVSEIAEDLRTEVKINQAQR